MNPPNHPKHAAKKRGFSMVEMIACVSIIGIIAFMAIPSITRMRSDSERNLAISRAESLNLAMSTYIQVVGRTQAALNWSGKTNEQRYTLIRDYLAYAEATLSAYMPQDYTATLPTSITAMTKTTLVGPSGNIIY
ncbi:MAG: type II secretion system GspH family protein [Prosthecobacter sp.]|jgi:prepilin-type N-terminal cleavage/methylation domain-containing protein|nr:type II secretion system GspH family protein [Prosthecobacter sp.]